MFEQDQLFDAAGQDAGRFTWIPVAHCLMGARSPQAERKAKRAEIERQTLEAAGQGGLSLFEDPEQEALL